MMIKMEPRRLRVVLHIDTNQINGRQKIPAMNQLEAWERADLILINMSGTARGEAKAGGDAPRNRKADQQIFTCTDPDETTDRTYRKIEQALFPNGVQDENQRNDVRIVYDAAKYGARLVTADGASRSQPGGILGNRHKLTGLVEILTPDEAVATVRRQIQERDDFNRRVAQETGQPLPDWTGKD